MKNIAIALCLAGLLFGCDLDTHQTTAQIEMTLNENNQQRLIKAVPVPALQTSLERKNLVRRLERINKEDAISYLYLVSYGKIMAYFTIRGKVSSLNSYLTAMERVERYGSTMDSYQYIALEAPDQDGSYGKNADGIFFFTSDGVYGEWKGDYFWSDQPLKLVQPPELVREIK